MFVEILVFFVLIIFSFLIFSYSIFVGTRRSKKLIAAPKTTITHECAMKIKCNKNRKTNAKTKQTTNPNNNNIYVEATQKFKEKKKFKNSSQFDGNVRIQGLTRSIF